MDSLAGKEITNPRLERVRDVTTFVRSRFSGQEAIFLREEICKPVVALILIFGILVNLRKLIKAHVT